MSLRDEARQSSDRSWEVSQIGDEVGGIVTARGEFTHAEFGTSPTVSIDAEYCVEGGNEVNGIQVTVFGFGTVLANKINEQDPQPGDEISISYNEDRTSKSGNPYKYFGVSVKHKTLRSEAQGQSADADW